MLLVVGMYDTGYFNYGIFGLQCGVVNERSLVRIVSQFKRQKGKLLILHSFLPNNILYNHDV